MTGYFLLLAIEIGLIFLFYGFKRVARVNNAQLWYLSLSFAVLFFFSSFRAAHIGQDYKSYITALQYIKDTGTYYMEPGYILLNKIILLITDHHFGVAIATNLMLMVPLFIMIVQCVDRKYWPICVMIFLLNPYMYLQSTFNIMRQGCATGLVISSLLLIRRKQIWKKILSVVFIVLAAQFHRMAYSMLVLVPVVLLPWKKKYWMIIGTIAFVVNMFGIDLFSMAIQLISEKYVDYAESLLNIGVYAIFLYAIILGLCYYYDMLCTDVRSKMFIDLYLFSLSYLLIALPNDIAYRIYITLAFTAIPAVPVIWEKLGTLRVVDLPIVGELPVWKKIKRFENFTPVRYGYVLYYFGFYIFYIIYLYICQNAAYIPFSLGF